VEYNINVRLYKYSPTKNTSTRSSTRDKQGNTKPKMNVASHEKPQKSTMGSLDTKTKDGNAMSKAFQEALNMAGTANDIIGEYSNNRLRQKQYTDAISIARDPKAFIKGIMVDSVTNTFEINRKNKSIQYMRDLSGTYFPTSSGRGVMGL
jgi:flagellar capping protein FliD